MGSRSDRYGPGLDRLPLSIEEGARLFRRLRLPSATIEAFLAAVRRGTRARAAREALGLDREQFDRLVAQAEGLLGTLR